jgi:hypothetical protein
VTLRKLVYTTQLIDPEDALTGDATASDPSNSTAQKALLECLM